MIDVLARDGEAITNASGVGLIAIVVRLEDMEGCCCCSQRLESKGQVEVELSGKFFVRGTIFFLDTILSGT